MQDVLEMPIQQDSEIALIARKIQTGLSVFETRKNTLTEKVKSISSLSIVDSSDKKGYKAVSDARKDLKAERVQIEKEGKAMRDPLTTMSKLISVKEKELVAITGPAEDELYKKERWYENENERIRKEVEEKEAARVQHMANQLAQYNFPFNIEQLKTVTEEQFAEALTYAKEAFEKKEFERLAAEKAESDRKFAEAELIQKERAELEELRRQQAETARLQKEQQDKINAENKRIADEKAAIETARLKAIEDERRVKELEEAKAKAAEEARLKAIADAKVAEERKMEQERKAKAAADRKARLAPDKDKLTEFAKSLSGIVNFQVKSQEANALVDEIRISLGNLQQTICSKAETL